MNNREINQILDNFEVKYDVNILFAVHGGGRQLGIYNKNSDTDVCLIFSPRKETSINGKDIMLHGDIDIAGRNINCLFNGLNELFLKIQTLKEYSFAELSYACLMFIYIKSPAIRDTKNFIEYNLPIFNRLLPSKILFEFYLNRSDFNRERISNGVIDVNSIYVCPLLYTIRSIYSAKWVYEKKSIPPSDLINLFEIEKNKDIIYTIKKMISEYKLRENNKAEISKDIELIHYFDNILTELKKKLQLFPDNFDYNNDEIKKINDFINQKWLCL